MLTEWHSLESQCTSFQPGSCTADLDHPEGDCKGALLGPRSRHPCTVQEAHDTLVSTDMSSVKCLPQHCVHGTITSAIEAYNVLHFCINVVMLDHCEACGCALPPPGILKGRTITYLKHSLVQKHHKRSHVCMPTRQLKATPPAVHSCLTPAYHGRDVGVDGKGLCILLVAVHSFIQVDQPIFSKRVSEPLVTQPILVPSNRLIARHKKCSSSRCPIESCLLIRSRL